MQFEFASLQHFASVRVQVSDQPERIAEAAVEVSDDGVAWRKVTDQSAWLNNPNVLWQQSTFSGTSARFFRLVVTKLVVAAKTNNTVHTLPLTLVQFGGSRLLRLEEQAGYKPNRALRIPSAKAPTGVALADVFDLTAHAAAGRLEWQVPEGYWTILRMGYTLTGKRNGPAAESARGLECDKLSRAAVETHFDGMMGEVIKAVGPLAGETFTTVLVDSWEAGCQNWTPAFRAEFLRRRGYDLMKYLPAIAGRSAAVT